MANYNDNIQGFIEGLSDFWLLYFKEIDQLKVLYQGAEFLVGQSYLDMLSLLLNNSAQDCPLFNKELFKLLQIRETDIKFLQKGNPESDRYVYTLPDGLVDVPALHNKILNVTDALTKGLNYSVNSEDLTLEFPFDPLNAYLQETFGSNDSEFTLRTRRLSTQSFSVQLNDNGTTPVAFTLNATETLLTISYDGPANTGTTQARDIVGIINIHPLYKDWVLAELTTPNGGLGSPAGTGIVPFKRVSINPLDNYASRTLNVDFGGKLTAGRVSDWVSLGVQKGDIIRFIAGPQFSSERELTVSLVRSDALYTNPDMLLSDYVSTGELAFSILREPYNNQSVGEPIPNTGATTQSGVDGVITASSRIFSAASAVFSPLHVGELLEINGFYNIGYVRILNVLTTTTVEIASTNLINEITVGWGLLTSMSPSVILTDGALSLNPDGTISFTTSVSVFLVTNPVIGTVIRIYRASVVEQYRVTSRISDTEVIINSTTAVAGTGLTWGWARYIPSATTVAWDYIKEGTVTISGRNAISEQALVEGVDYVIDSDLAQIRPLTVWRTDVNLTTTYDYRINVQPINVSIQSGSDGTLTYGTPSTFSAPTASFNAYDIGHSLDISDSSISPTETNNGKYIIASIVNATTVTLKSDRQVKTTPDSNNGALIWEEQRLATLSVNESSAQVYETAFWAPDVLVDRYHLYNTFGYLINRFDASSEEYRALIRGIFQLFMLGPTLERFESAVNTVAGIPVVRDNGEILLRYDSNALQQNSDGYLSASTNTFVAASAVFTNEHVSAQIYVRTGTNNNKLFKIVRIVSPTEVELATVPVSEGPVEWELMTGTEHNIVTSKRTYSFPRTIPLRTDITNPANVGLLILNAFEVLTTVFTVTDYVETPQWWARVQIPEELWSNEDAARRQATPALVENVIDPSDDGRVGDPGFLIGADSLGFTPPSSVKYVAPTADGVLEGDYAYPFSNNVYFNSTVNNVFTPADIGDVLVTDGKRYRIIEQISSSRVKLEVFERVYNASSLNWSIETQPIVLRNKAAFVVLDTWLKYHLFSVSFDPSFLGQVSPTLIPDLNELVFVVKPTYTYLILSPSSLFKELVKLTESFEYSLSATAGDQGNVIASNTNPLLIGSGWRIGDWFRYIENTSSFATPTASVPDVLGVPDAGYAHHVTKFFPDPANLTAGSIPIQATTFVEYMGPSGVNALIQYIDTSTYKITLPSAEFTTEHIGDLIRIYKLGSPYNGDLTIGAVESTTVAVVSLPYLVGIMPQASWPAAGDNLLTWQIITKGSAGGYIRNSTSGECLFTNTTGLHRFNPADVGTYVRFVFVAYPENQSFRITSVAGTNVTDCKLASLTRYYPIEGDPDEVGAVSGLTLTTTVSLFTLQMCRANRFLLDPTTELTQQFFVVFTSGANSGQRRRLETFGSPTSVTVTGATLTTDPSASFYIENEDAPVVSTETGLWEHLKNSIVINGNTVTLPVTPTQDADTVPFTAYGLRQPVDPSLETFDETLGDTYYTIGLLDPRPAQGRSRTGRDADLREDPIQITRT